MIHIHTKKYLLSLTHCIRAWSSLHSRMELTAFAHGAHCVRSQMEQCFFVISLSILFIHSS